MGFHGGGWFSFLGASERKPKVTWLLLRRVFSYAKPYRGRIIAMLVLILFSTGLTLLTPLVLRDLIDRTIPSADIDRLVRMALALLLIPASMGAINVVQRRINAQVGEGVIYDLRVALYDRLQRMSLRFFTNTKVGELMSRLNNDVVGAQNAISNTIVSIITNLVQAAALLVVMLTLEWRLTLISIVILPLFILAARRLGGRLRDIARKQMEANAAHECHDERNAQHWRGAAGQAVRARPDEVTRFQDRARDGARSRHPTRGDRHDFLHHHRPLSAVGTALVYGLGGYFVIQKHSPSARLSLLGPIWAACTAPCRA